MKHMKYLVFAGVMVVMVIAPTFGFAAEAVPGNFAIPAAGSTAGTAPETGALLIARIQLIANWVFAFFLAISLIYIILGAFQFVTAGGDPAQISSARQKLIFALIGIAIGLLTFGIPAIIRSIVV